MHILSCIWGWLTNNASALQAVSALAAIPLLLAAGSAARRAALAAEDQAKAARAQVAAAERAAELSEQQLQASRESATAERESSEQHLAAARDSAEAERAHSALIQQQLLASQQPVLVFDWFSAATQTRWGISLTNQSSSAVASMITVSRRTGNQAQGQVEMTSDVAGPGAKVISVAQFVLSNSQEHATTLTASYFSQDGRRFETTVAFMGSSLRQVYREVPTPPL